MLEEDSEHISYGTVMRSLINIIRLIDDFISKDAWIFGKIACN